MKHLDIYESESTSLANRVPIDRLCYIFNTIKLKIFLSSQGWIQHDLVGGGGGGGGGRSLPALVPSCVGHVRRPLINLLDYCKVLLDYCI
jgi:hypothetical protein